eukprot:3433780-Alexandrium_andersonii.AAC.1
MCIRDRVASVVQAHGGALRQALGRLGRRPSLRRRRGGSGAASARTAAQNAPLGSLVDQS